MDNQATRRRPPQPRRQQRNGQRRTYELPPLPQSSLVIPVARDNEEEPDCRVAKSLASPFEIGVCLIWRVARDKRVEWREVESLLLESSTMVELPVKIKNVVDEFWATL